MKKKLLLTMVLICVGVLALGMLNVSAAESGTCGSKLTWTLDDSGTLTISGTGKMRDWSYASSVPWYSSRKNIETVVIDEGVTSIGNYAFYECSSLTSIEIPDSVTSIGNYAFYECSSLTSIEIPDSVTSIGSYAFWWCSGLTSVTIPNSVTSIGSYVFYNCTSLTSVTILDSVTSVTEQTFYNCTGLTSIEVSEKNEYYSSDSYGVLYNKNKTELIAYPCGSLETEFVIPDSVTSIESYAFDDCTGLTSVTIPDSVTSLGSYAFSGCSGLTSVTIPNSVTSIGSHAFSGCSGLTSVTIPNSVTSIESYAFHNCTGLTSVTIPDSVTSIGDYAFQSCSGLTSVTIPDSVTSIGRYAFWWCSGLTSVTIPNSVTSIGNDAFSKCSGLEKINWNAKNVADFVSSYNNVFFEAGKDGNGIEVIFGDSVERIPAYAFNPCGYQLYAPKITSIKIGENVNSIGNGAFRYSESLTGISVSEKNEYYFSDSYGVLYNKDKTRLIQYPAGSLETEFVIQNSVEIIDEYAFCGCSNLKNVMIPNSVTSIGSSAFSGCSGLTSVTIPDSVTSIGSYAFNWCRGLTRVTIPDSVTSIGGYAFQSCSGLTSVTIPDSVTSIGIFAFQSCSGLTSVTIPNSVTKITSYAFYNCSKIETVYYNGTKDDWNKISISSGNTYLTDAKRIYFAYVTVCDKDGKKVIETTQNMGETVDTSSITVPDGYKLKLYKDEAMTKEYSIETPIEKNLVLYMLTIAQDKVSVTVDGKETEVNGQIVLGAENTDGSYSLPDNVVGYYVNDDFVDAGKYDVSDGDIITTVKFNVDVLLGAQVRYGGGVDANGKVGKGNGLRFIAQVDRSNFDGEGYGMKIEAEGSSVFTEIDAVKWQNAEETVFSVAITDMAVSNYNRNFTATPYVKVKYTDGTEKTVYGTKSVTRSIYYIATGLLKNGVNEEDYTLTGNASLYNVLNAYVNMVGVRLNLYSDGTVSANTEKEGKYTGEAFFDVECVKDGDVYSVTVTPVTEEFANPVTIKDYWKEFVRINNNNSAVKEMIENENVDENGVLTFEFKVK